jgi:hypothetical protein
MLQRLKRLNGFLGIYLNQRQGLAFLERRQASDCSADDRDRVRRILRATLTLPADPVHAPSSPDVPDHAASLVLSALGLPRAPATDTPVRASRVAGRGGGPSRPGGGVHKPVDNLTLRAEAGEALRARGPRSPVPRAAAAQGAWGSRRYC